MTIVTGFLGAGKTSLLNHVLAVQHARRLAVLVGDCGAIDAQLITNENEEVVSLANGCGGRGFDEDFLLSILRLARRKRPPEHILIETSGVADSVQVARAFSDSNLQAYAPLDGVVSVVDAELAPTLAGDALHLAAHQAAAADVVILNKTDLVDNAGLGRAREWVCRCAPRARLLEVTHGRAPVESILGIEGGSQLTGGIEAACDHGRHGEPPFDSYTYVSDEPLSVLRLRDTLRGMPRTVFRAKGIINVSEKPGRPIILHATGRRATLTVGESWGERARVTQVVFIGSRGGVDGQWLTAHLAHAPGRRG